MWTPRSVKEHFDGILADRNVDNDRRFKELQEAQRAASQTVQQRYVSEDSYNADKQSLTKRIGDLEQANRDRAVKRGVFGGIGQKAVVLIGLALTVLYIYSVANAIFGH